MSPIDWRPIQTSPQRNGYARLTVENGSLAFASSYDAELVVALKQKIPPEARHYDKDRRIWLVASSYGQTCADLALMYLGVALRVPAISTTTKSEQRLIRLDYLGRSKGRGNGTRTAFGHVDGDWSVIFPEEVLRQWFEQPAKPAEMFTLYAVLAVKESATPDEIRRAYRRLALMWHPDRCHEPDAAEQFKRVHAAYEVLSEPLKRKKYDAGLYFERQTRIEKQPERRWNYIDQDGWICPLRCGYVLVEGSEIIGRFVVSKILQWEDVTDEQGRMMITSWGAGQDHFEVRWV